MAGGDWGHAVSPGAVAAVVGCGSMGRGIAQLLAKAELDVRLYDADPTAAAGARVTIAADLDKLVGRAKMTAGDAAKLMARLEPVSATSELAGASLVVEAVVEDLEIKRRLFVDLESVLGQNVGTAGGARAILATNTSSLSVTAIAAACRHPERVAGFHFFNPAPVMKIVEVIAAARTDGAVCDALVQLAERFGHTAVRAADTPGFIVNHAGRAYVTEGLKILAEGVCDPSVLDAVLRDACGFRLGPCELLDLTGLDVSQPVMDSIYHQYHEEPRYRPQVMTQRMLEAGLLGRKRGAGFYRYADGEQERSPLLTSPLVSPPPVWVDPTAPELAATARAALAPGVALDTGAAPAERSLIVVTPVGRDTTHMIVSRRLDMRRTVGFDSLFVGRAVRCLFASPGLLEAWREPARAAFARDGAVVHLVRDSIGLIAQRVLAHIVNVACSIAEQRIASPADIDRAVKLGLGYPQGPLAWGDSIGPASVRGVLDGLHAATGDPRYRPSAWLTRRAALGLSLAHPD